MSSTASSAVASARSRSPTATATTERLKRFPARAGGDRAGARPRWRRRGARRPQPACRARTRSWAGSGTGGTRDPLAQSRERASGHDSRARRPRRRDRGRARPQRARRLRRGGARARRRTTHPRALRLRHGGSSCFGRSGHGVRERGHGERHSHQGCISQHLRVAHSAPGPVVHRLVSRAVELVQRQLDQQLDGLDRGPLWQAAKRPHKPLVGLLVSPELTLHRGAGRHNGRAEGARLLRDDRDRLLQRFMAVGEMARRRQRPCTGEQKLDALLCRRGLGSTRSAAPNQRAALSGASRAAASPASRRTATAATSPWRADRSTWWARAAAVTPWAASASAHRSWAPSRQPPAVASYTARRTSGCRKRKRRGTSVERMRSSSRSSSTACIAAASEVAAAAAASSGSNGSPATAAPSSTRRPPPTAGRALRSARRRPLAGLRGRSPRSRERGWLHLRARATGRAARGRRGCHRTPRRGRLRRRRRPFRREALEPHPASERRARAGSAPPHDAPARGRPQDAPGLAGAERHCREHGRRRRPAQQRAEQLDRPGVSPWKSSSTRTSGLV